MKQGLFTIIENVPIADKVMKMRLRGDLSAIAAPGQVVNIKIDVLYLRRPISVCDAEGETLTLIYKIVGVGTEKMSGMQSGTLDILTGLGNGYDLNCCGEAPLLLGGGVGVPPLYMLAKSLIKRGKNVYAVLGFKKKGDVFYEDEFRSLGVDTTVVTADGSYGKHGFVTDSLPSDYTYFYTCGPEPMLHAEYEKTNTSGQFSFEKRMGCGFGACMGCSCKTITGYKRICKEGPVLTKEEILWEK